MTARPVLILIPCKRTMNPRLHERMASLAQRLPLANPSLDLVTLYDYRGEPKHPGDSTPWSKVTRVRNRLLETVDWERFTHVVWIDADVVDYPADLPTRLIEANPEGVCAPMNFIEGMPQRFYDTSAFTVDGQHFGIRPPYCTSPRWYGAPGRFVEVDSVGCVYSVNTDVYRAGARHEDHPTNTDHWPICVKAREMGRTVVVDRETWVAHANLPDFGEAWHEGPQ